MKICIVETQSQANTEIAKFDKVFVLSEAFQDFANIISIPAKLDGSDPTQRDKTIGLIGSIINPSLLNTSHNHIFSVTGYQPASISSLFELNIFSRHREFAYLASLDAACAAIKELRHPESITIKSGVRGVEGFVKAMCPEIKVFQQIKMKNKWAFAFRKCWLPLNEIAKSLIWLVRLLTVNILATRQQSVLKSEIQIWQHRNQLRFRERAGSLWSRHWQGMAEVAQFFPAEPDIISFSQGSFFDNRGKRIRYVCSREMVKIGLNILKILFASPSSYKKFCHSLEAHSSLGKSTVDLLGAPIVRSLLGPALVQGIWDCQIMSKLYETRVPSSIFYLAESQPWESCLLLASRSHPELVPRLFGVAHTAVRPWDLRYFRPLGWFSNGKDSLPLPDMLLATSPFCERRLSAYWNKSLAIELVETLRYQRRVNPKVSWNGLLVAMPYTASEEAIILSVTKRVEAIVGSGSIKLQPHPLRRLRERVATTSLLQERPSLFLTDTTSTVLLESAEAGIPTFALHCGSLPNMSALADDARFRDAHLVTNANLPHELVRGISRRRPSQPFDYYCRSEGFPLWRGLIYRLNIG